MDQAQNKLEEIKQGMRDESRVYKVISLSELYQTEFPENQWAIEKFIPLEGITIVSGAPVSFKTWLTLVMIIAIAKGEKFLGLFESNQSKILVIDEENHLREIQRRMKRLNESEDLPIFFLSQEGFLVRDEAAQKKVLKICEEKGIRMVLIDSLVRVNDADENVATQMSDFFRELKKFCKAGITVVLIHHERKESLIKGSVQSRLRGSSDILAAVDSHISMRKDKDDKNILVIEQSKLRCDKELEPFEISVSDEEDKIFFEYSGEHAKDITKQEFAKTIVFSVLKEFPDGLNVNHIVKNVLAESEEQLGDRTIRKAINSLIKSGQVLWRPGLKKEKICFLPPTAA